MDFDWCFDSQDMADELLFLLADDALEAPWRSPTSSPLLTGVELFEEQLPQETMRTKKRRVPRQTPKDEIMLLRRTIGDLESMLSVQKRRRATVPVIEGPRPPAGSGSLSVWRGVAARQLQLLRDSQHENHRLHGQVRRQTVVLKRLNRLVNGLQVPVESVRPVPVSMHQGIFAYKRRELLASTSVVYSTLDTTSANLSKRLSQGEFRDCSERIGIEAGTDNRSIAANPAILAQSRVGRIFPRDMSQAAQALWDDSVHNDIVHPTLHHLEHVEQDSNRYVVGFSLSFPDPHGLVVLQGVGVRTRVIEGERDASILTASLWPHPSTPSPFSAVGYNLAGTTIFQPHPSTCEEDEPMSELLMDFTYSHLEYSVPKQNMTREELATLESFVAQTRDHMVNSAHNLLDSMLLRHRA